MSGIENLSAGDLSPECIDVNEPELDIAEVVIWNVNYWLKFLEPCQQLHFFEWLKNHSRSEAALCETLDDCLANWLKRLPKQQALDEGFLIMGEIIWFKYRSPLASSKERGKEC